MHNDEAVNAVKFGQLWEKGNYRYDPNEHHGPTLIYGTWALERLTGAPRLDDLSDARLRSLTVIFGIGLILLLPLVADGLGTNGTVWAAVLTAVSPAFVYYSRYFIHEILLVFFTFLALASAWRYWRSRKLSWILLAGAALGLMDATKETFVINLAAASLAIALNQMWNRVLDASGLPVKAKPLTQWHLGAAFGVWVLVALTLFSSFFANPDGPVDSLRTYLPWLHRAGGDSPHIHPWNFYFQRLLLFHAGSGPVWTEGLVLILAVNGAIAGFRRAKLAGANASFVRFLAFYTLALTAAYTILAYKTPWCALGFWHGAILLAGVGTATLFRSLRAGGLQIAAACALTIGTGHLTWQAWAENTIYASDQRNPYVYAHTSADILNLVSKVETLANVSTQPGQVVIKVMAPDEDYWPLPWYLRRFHNTGWWSRVPQDPFAPLMIVSSKLNAALDEKGTHLMVGYFQLRPDAFFELYVEKQLWTTWLSKRASGSSPAAD
jgi:uncharacterized protein (TIGR03663 family)